MNAGPFRATIL
jgi:hypothetical protein